MTINQLCEAIRAMSAISKRDAAQAADAFLTHFPAASLAGLILKDCADELRIAADADDLDDRPADESWKARQDSALFQAHPGFGAAFDSLDKLSIRL